jgi:membrane protein YqaA with SNARE-associated domain
MSETLPSVVPSPRHDLLTVAAMGLVAYALANPLHEGLGHGGACLLVGGKPLVLSSLHFDGDTEGLPRGANRLIAAGGTLVNMLVGGFALAALLRSRTLPARGRYFLWLFAFVNLFQGTGYLLFSGVAGIGDWASVIAGWPMPWLWRLVMAVTGGLAYFVIMLFAMRRLAPFVGDLKPGRHRRAVVLSIVPYLTGSALFIISGLFNPVGLMLVLVSAVAASLGGTCGFLFGPQFFLDPDFAPTSEEPIRIARSWGWIATAAIVAVVFVSVLGPGIHFA